MAQVGFRGYSHLIYLDEFHRDHGTVLLNMEAMKAFGDTILIQHRAALRAERVADGAFIAAGKSIATEAPPPAPVSFALLHFMNYENLKIAAAFELHLKARLLVADFVLHKINQKAGPGYKLLAKRQMTEPIKKSELSQLSPYVSNGTSRYLPGLGDTSLNFELLVKEPQYVAALGLTTLEAGVIDDFRRLRNQIHLPGDVLETPHLGTIGAVDDFLINFINRSIVPGVNGLIARHGFNWPALSLLG